MHIADGFLPAKVCLAGYAVTGAATWFSLRQIRRDRDPQANIPKASLLTAAFFVGSLIHIPIPPASVHLVLNGLLGAVLGYYAFPAILVGLFFQAVMFQHGGMSVLGVNAAMMGIPAFLSAYVFQFRHRFGSDHRTTLSVFGFLAGALGVGLSALIFFAIVIANVPSNLNAEAERSAVWILTLSQIPLVIIEGVFTSMLVLFLQQVKPSLLQSTVNSEQ
ncbi:cobalt transporter CbiM [Baaleninema simplex]|uniref:cobalt transporter CbiM n=1 Tax=Baaleninema simplex TaxID=2862350 RepID=UPI0003449034|nr:cobalt transporter CbiM [Baaleninema simplex]